MKYQIDGAAMRIYFRMPEGHPCAGEEAAVDVRLSVDALTTKVDQLPALIEESVEKAITLLTPQATGRMQ